MIRHLQVWKLRVVVVLLHLLMLAPVVLAAPRPNVVLVMTDDQGYGDLSCHGNPVLKTPSLDQLYAESVRLTDYHVAPTCSPTRSALLTGHWTNRTGVWHTIMGRSILRANEVTMGQVFQDAGYATGMFGKWHLGDNYPFRPEDRGYGEVLRHGGGGVGQTPDYWDNAYFDGSYFRNSKPEPAKGFCTDVFFAAAKEFIAKHVAIDQPFLAYIATNAPHGPMHSPEASSAPYADLGVNTANFFGMIANIDDNVGRLREFLAEQGVAENTIFIFATDNGTSSGEKVFNAGMRGKKGSPYDGGHRVPLFVHWPEGNLVGGRDVTPITAHIDVLPTLIDLCGIEPPAGVTFDGTSLRPLLEQTNSDWPDRILVTDSQRVKDPIKWRQSSVMTSQWRLINGKELYDMHSDPGQKNDVAARQPQVVDRLREFYDAWWEELLPTFKDDCAIVLGHEAENPACLTGHDWIGKNPPWSQWSVRSATKGTGYWNVEVHEAGKYEFRLRRWPIEANIAINAPLAAGKDVPGVKAVRTRPGKSITAIAASLQIAGKRMEKSVDPDDLEAIFQLDLPAGKTTLDARFRTKVGEEIGAYYVYVERL